MMNATVFAVLGEPYCVWEHPEDDRNVEFLNGIDAEYFSYVARSVAGNAAEDADDHRAAILLRTAYYHGLETLFSLLSALVQAPGCVYGWLEFCKTEGLRKIVDQISGENFNFPVGIDLKRITWTSLARGIHAHVGGADNDREVLAEGFGNLWTRMAGEFLDRRGIEEYNSLKHGFRVKAGGFDLAIGPEVRMGVPAAPESMVPLGGSKFGTAYLRLERVGGKDKTNRSYRTLNHMRNWNVDQTALLLQLVGGSILNVVSALKILNGIAPDQVKFSRPSKDAFEAPWKHSVGIRSANFERTIPDWAVRATTKDELLGHLNVSGSSNSAE